MQRKQKKKRKTMGDAMKKIRDVFNALEPWRKGVFLFLVFSAVLIPVAAVSSLSGSNTFIMSISEPLIQFEKWASNAGVSMVFFGLILTINNVFMLLIATNKYTASNIYKSFALVVVPSFILSGVENQLVFNISLMLHLLLVSHLLSYKLKTIIRMIAVFVLYFLICAVQTVLKIPDAFFFGAYHELSYTFIMNIDPWLIMIAWMLIASRKKGGAKNA